MRELILGHIPAIEGWWGGLSLFKVSPNADVDTADVFCRDDDGNLVQQFTVNLDRPYQKSVQYLPKGTTSVVVQCSDNISVNGFCGEDGKENLSFVPLDQLKK